MKIWPNLEQQSEQWFRLRKGRITASNADRILTPTGKDSSQWEAFAIELTAECIRPDELPSFSGNHHTDRGNELEPIAREEFSRIMGLEIVQVGFVTRDDGVVGFSPDSLILKKGVTMDAAIYDTDGAIINGKDLFMAGLEVKCPMAKNHATYLIDGGAPKAYHPQTHFSMAAADMPWYFMSYCPGMASHIALIEPDGYTAKMADATDRFLIYYSERRKQIMPLLLGKEAA